MNFNEQQNRYADQGGRRLIRRPNEIPGSQGDRSIPNAYPNLVPLPQYSQSPYPMNNSYEQNVFQNNSSPYPPHYTPSMSAPMPGQNNVFGMPPQSSILSDPMANVAMQYGQVLVGSSKEIVDKEIRKYVPISKLRYYFAVDTAYVSKKLSIVLFPYMHSDWSIKFDQNEPIPPKFDVNAPDLYIPVMAFLTYVLVAGLILGVKNLFSPEKLGMEATSALAWTTFEVIIQLLTLYIANIDANLKTFDLISYSSYKYVGIIVTMLISLLLGRTGYLVCLVYIGVSISFFLIRALKLQILAESTSTQTDMYGMPQSAGQQGLKRRRYFLLFVACTQPLLIWWFTWRIV